MKLLITTLAIAATLTTSPAQLSKTENIPGLTIYPKGDVFPFLGYSGKPALDAKNGFTITGPDYGTMFFANPKQRDAKLQRIRNAKLPHPFFVGLNMRFHDKKLGPRKITETEIRAEITLQVRSLLNEPLLCWWYIGPEELRFWRKNEFDYLRVVTETIRELDPHKRPIWMYEPNHRTAKALVKTGQYQDIIGKGSYVNLAGYHQDRIWVKWSIEQEINTIKTLSKKDDRTRIPLMMPELCADPKNPADDIKIPTWVRHDCYLGLTSGAKGIAIWSLFKRTAVKRSYDKWYNAYAEIAQELTGELDLGRVFLFGKKSQAITHTQTSGPDKIKLFVGDRTKLELGTSTPEEIKGATHHYSAVNSSTLDYKGSTYSFIINSHPTDSATIKIKTEKELITLPDQKKLTNKIQTLAPFQVLILKTK